MARYASKTKLNGSQASAVQTSTDFPFNYSIEPVIELSLKPSSVQTKGKLTRLKGILKSKPKPNRDTFEEARLVGVNANNKKKRKLSRVTRALNVPTRDKKKRFHLDCCNVSWILDSLYFCRAS